MAVVNYYNWKMDDMDIVTAFLNRDLKETIYMGPPEGSGIPGSKLHFSNNTVSSGLQAISSHRGRV